MKTISTVYLVLGIIFVIVLFFIAILTPVGTEYRPEFNWSGLILTILFAFSVALGYYILRGIALIGLQVCEFTKKPQPLDDPPAAFLTAFNRISTHVIPSYAVENYGEITAYNASFKGSINLSLLVETSTKHLQEITVRCPQEAGLAFWDIAYDTCCAANVGLFQTQPYMDKNRFIAALSPSEGQTQKKYVVEYFSCIVSQRENGMALVLTIAV